MPKMKTKSSAKKRFKLTGWFYILIGIGFPIANLLEYRKKGL